MIVGMLPIDLTQEEMCNTMAFKPKKITAIAETKSFTPTAEQVANLRLVESEQNVKIIAAAGTGKSSSLRYIAASMPHKQFLVWCFNAANAEESNSHPDKPSNITYSTGHSTAYRKIVDTDMRKKLAPYLNYMDLPLTPKDIQEILQGMVKDYDKNTSLVKKSILDCITHFCRSDSESTISFAEDYFYYIFKTKALAEGTLCLGNDAISLLTVIAEEYWSDLIDRKHPAKITHDVYLKMFQLAKFIVDDIYDKSAKTFVRPDIICMDESQDLNPVMESIFSIQPHQKLLIGDPYQQLYAWRGAGNAMNHFKDYAVGYLTESFRFNTGIADMANLILRRVGSDMVVKGSSTKTEITSHAHLCRTNASVVNRIFAELGSGKKVYTSIKISDIFSKLYHMHSCWYNERPKYPSKELEAITDKESLIKALEYSEELQRLNTLRLHLTAGGKTLTSAKKDLDSILVNTPEEANIVISTIHCAKGLQWAHVVIDDDFLTIREDDIEDYVIEDMWNTSSLTSLIYVAITRAEVDCIVPWYLEGLFKKEES